MLLERANITTIGHRRLVFAGSSGSCIVFCIMEVLRPSTPIPHTRVSKYNYFRNRRYPSDSCLPHLQPLIEETRASRSWTTGDLCQPFQRCAVTCDEREAVEIFTLSPNHANILKLRENGLQKINPNFTRLPDISTESEADSEVDSAFERSEGKLRHKQNKGPQSGQKNVRIRQDSEPRWRQSSTSSTHSSSLPCLEYKNVNTHKYTNNATLRKHVEQEDKNFDPVINREVMFKKYFEGQR